MGCMAQGRSAQNDRFDMQGGCSCLKLLPNLALQSSFCGGFKYFRRIIITVMFSLAGNKGELILRKLEMKQAAPAARPALGTAPVSEVMRHAGTQRILAALRGSPAGSGVDEAHLAAAAQVRSTI